MLKLLKKLLLPVTAVALLAVLAGCTGTAAGLPRDPSQFTDQNVRDIVATAVNNVLQASSFTGTYVSRDVFDSSNNQSGFIPSISSMNATMLSDREAGRAKGSLSITVAPKDTASSTPPEQLDVATYLYADYLYVHITTIPGLPWYKVPVTDAVLDVFSTRLFDNQVHMFDLPASVSYLRSESYNGTECYVINVVPNPDQLLKILKQEQPQGVTVDWSRLGDVTRLFKNVSYTVWVSRDTLRFVKVQSHAETDFSAAAALSNNPALAGLAITSDGTMYFTNYNKSVVINLPEAAAKAREVSPSQLTQDAPTG